MIVQELIDSLMPLDRSLEVRVSDPEDFPGEQSACYVSEGDACLGIRHDATHVLVCRWMPEGDTPEP